MDKNTKFLGIDISKDVFDVNNHQNEHFQFLNNFKGFKQFLKKLDKHDVCVMEATAYYHLKLAYFLIENGYKVSIVNPLSVKRFVQMKLSKIKTDKADAKMIRLYAEKNDIRLWMGNSKNQVEAQQILRLLDVFTKHSTAIKNKIHGEETLGNPSKIVNSSLKRSLKHLQKEIKTLEDKLIELIKEEHQ